MQYINAKISEELNFFGKTNPYELLEKFGSPLYVYNENVLLEKIRCLKNLVKYENFNVYYSAKANSNLAILQIACKEGLHVDAMSPGEIYVQLAAGFKPENIFYVGNNVSESEMRYAIDAGVIISVDSVSQLRMFGRINRGGSVSLRLNCARGVGHHEKVITTGKKTKFGINSECIPECKNIIKEYDLKVIGINQHIGSFFLDIESYLEGVRALVPVAKQFESLEFIDFGGGFGIPYHKQEGEMPLDMQKLGEALDKVFEDFASDYGKRIDFHIEPGRYIPCESGIVLGEVYSIKHNVKKYVGTDIGFNVLMRQILYDAHHDIEVYRKSDVKSEKEEPVTIVGNICESGDILASDRMLPEIFEGDIIGVLDVGAYGHSMASTYNNRLRPAEVLIRENGEAKLIRKRDSLEDLLTHYVRI